MPRGPRAPEAIAARWVEAALRAGGAIEAGARLASVAVEAIGDLGGVNGEAYRVRLAYAAGDGPATVVAKFPAAREGARRTAAFQRWYEREVHFYTTFAASTPVRTARCLAAEIDDDGEYVLLLEDLRPGRTQGDQVAGCGVEQARAAVEAAARLHARWWGDAAPPVSDAVPETTVGLERAERVQGALARSWARAQALNDFPRAVGAGMPAFVAAYPRVLASMAAAPVTLAHGDYRLDNVFFDADGDVAVIDWQFACRCRGMYDVGYFVGLDLDAATRRAHEAALIARYVAVLASEGVRDYGADEAWRDYRRALLLGFAVFLIGSAGEQPNERMTVVHEVGLARLAAAIAETDAFAAIEGL